MEKNSTPNPERLKKLADYFGVSVEYLMTGEETNGYYLNEETAKMAQEMFEDPDMRSLFDMKKKYAAGKVQSTYGIYEESIQARNW